MVPRSPRGYKNGSSEVWETKRKENNGQTILHTSLTSLCPLSSNILLASIIKPFLSEQELLVEKVPIPTASLTEKRKFFTPALLDFSLWILLSVTTASLPTGCVPAEAACNIVSFCLGFYEVDICPLATGEEPPVHAPQLPACQQALTISSCC